MKVDVILGLQWGDEGKGKIVDYLAPHYDIVARFQGGPNAGHTLKFDGKKFVLHTVPSGIFRNELINVVGNGVVLDPITFEKEIRTLQQANVQFEGRLFIAEKAHLILPTHRLLDAASEAAKGKDKIGSTLRGIGPAYMDKTGRNGLRVGDVLSPNFEKKYKLIKNKHLDILKLYPEINFDLEKEETNWFESLATLRSLPIIDVAYFLNKAIANGKRILAEGAQGVMLDVDFGTYPFVTSSNTITAGVCTGLGIAPNKIGEVIGISKAYCTRVGSGPFPTELHDAVGEKLRTEGGEFGATTGRPRRCGWVDIPQLRYAIMVNGVTQIALTKIDVLNNFEEVMVAAHYTLPDGTKTDELPFDLEAFDGSPHYEAHAGWLQSLADATTFDQLPDAAHRYILQLEKMLNTPITMVSTGPERDKLIVR